MLYIFISFYLLVFIVPMEPHAVRKWSEWKSQKLLNSKGNFLVFYYCLMTVVQPLWAFFIDDIILTFNHKHKWSLFAAVDIEVRGNEMWLEENKHLIWIPVCCSPNWQQRNFNTTNRATIGHRYVIHFPKDI